MTNNYTQKILEKNRSINNKTVLIDDTRSCTYGELENFVLKFSLVLQSHVNPGDRVIILLDDCVEFAVGALSVIAVGAVPVMASIDQSNEDLAKVIETSNAKLILTSLDTKFDVPVISKADILIEQGQNISVFYNWHPDEHCYWYLTSGTSGDSKYMVHRHDNLFILPELVHYNTLRIKADSVVMTTPKLQFAYGFGVFLSTLLQGSVMILSEGRPAPTKVFSKLNKYSVSSLITSVHVLNSILKHKKGQPFPASVNYVLCGGEPMPDSLANGFYEEFKIKITNGLGIAEIGNIFCLQDYDNPEFGTIGKPIPGVQLEVRNEDGAVVPVGSVGELYVKSPCTASLYWKNWNKTKDAFVGHWFRTGDNVMQLPSGNFKFISRTNGALKINHEYVTTTEIESAILENENILDCMVVFKYNEVSEIHAHVVSRSKDNMNLKDFLKKRLPAHKIPKYFNFMEKLPTTITGKKLRRAV